MSEFDFTPDVEVKVLDARLEEWGLPTYQTPMAAAIDMHACLDNPLILHPGEQPTLISSGIAVYLNNPHMAAVLMPRSGLGHKKGLVLGNLVGLIDADYTAAVMISAWNRNAPGTDPVVIHPGERIAQLMFVPVIRPNLRIVDEFSGSTQRGGGGFGSTGTKHQG